MDHGREKGRAVDHGGVDDLAATRAAALHDGTHDSEGQ
jgi:hypothetical protein